MMLPTPLHVCMGFSHNLAWHFQPLVALAAHNLAATRKDTCLHSHTRPALHEQPSITWHSLANNLDNTQPFLHNHSSHIPLGEHIFMSKAPLLLKPTYLAYHQRRHPNTIQTTDTHNASLILESHIRYVQVGPWCLVGNIQADTQAAIVVWKGREINLQFLRWSRVSIQVSVYWSRSDSQLWMAKWR